MLSPVEAFIGFFSRINKVCLTPLLTPLSPEECETVTVLDDGRIAGDRVLGVRFADTEAADDAWSKKTGMAALVNTPGLVRR